MASTETVAIDALSAVEHGGGGMPQLDFITFPSQIFWLLVLLVALYYLLSKIALPRIASVIEERDDAITDDLDSAAEFRRKAEDAERAYAEALAEARVKAQEIASETKVGIQSEIDAAIAKADSKISAWTAKGEKQIAAIRKDATADIETIATETAEAVVEAMLPGAASVNAVRSAVAAQLKR